MIYKYQMTTPLGLVTVWLPTKDVPDEEEATEMIRKALEQTLDQGEKSLDHLYDWGLTKNGNEPPLDEWQVKQMKKDPEILNLVAESLMLGTDQGQLLAHLNPKPLMMPERSYREEPEYDPLEDPDSEVTATLTPITGLSPEEEEGLIDPDLIGLLLEGMPTT